MFYVTTSVLVQNYFFPGQVDKMVEMVLNVQYGKYRGAFMGNRYLLASFIINISSFKPKIRHRHKFLKILKPNS